MNGDESPVSSTDMPLKAGQLVTIFNAEAPDAENSGEIYAFQNPGWVLVGRLDAGTADTLKKLIEGDKATVSDNNRNAFVWLGNFETWAQAQAEIDKLHATGEDNTKVGEFRLLLNGRNIIVRNFVQNWATGVFTQTVQGSIQWNTESQTMDQSLNINTYERRYNEGTGWTTWEEGTAKIELAQELSTEEGSENKTISQKVISQNIEDINIKITENHFFAYNESFSKIALSVNSKFRRKNYIIGYFNINTSKYELYEYTGTIFTDPFWQNASYWKLIDSHSLDILEKMYNELYSLQAFSRNNLARVYEDESYNLLDVSKSFGLNIRTDNGVITQPNERQTILGSDDKVSAPIDVSNISNVTIFSADIKLTNPPAIYKYDSVGKFLGYTNTTTLPYTLDTSDCSYIRIKYWRKTNLQVVAGTEVQPQSSPLWAFRSLYSEDVLLPTKLLYLDQFVLPYYVEAITTNNNVEVFGAHGLGIVNRKELFMPKSEGIFNIMLSYGYKSMTNMQVSIKKARLASANKNPIILCMGDSFTEIGAWQITLKENLESLGITPTFIGAMHSVNTRLSKVGISENQTGGKLKVNFMQSVTGKCYIVNVTGVTDKEMPINFNRYVTYDCNGYRWTVWGYQLDEQGDGKIRLYCTDSSASLPTSGVLQKAGGTGDTSINYDGITEVNKNPFYNIETQQLDFNGYLSTWGYDIPQVVCLLFGENDMLTSTFNRTFWQDVQEFIEKWHEQIPSTKFVIGCSKLYRRYADNWGESNKRSIFYFMKKLDILYKDSDYVYICPTWAHVDPVDAFDNVEVVASSRLQEKKFIRQNDVHPITAGMQQIGDAMTPYVVDALSE